jgi:hypothetical protein
MAGPEEKARGCGDGFGGKKDDRKNVALFWYYLPSTAMSVDYIQMLFFSHKERSVKSLLLHRKY